MYLLQKSPESCWSVNTFSAVREKGKKNNLCKCDRNTINDGDSQTSFLLIFFSEGGGTSVHRLIHIKLYVLEHENEI